MDGRIATIKLKQYLEKGKVDCLNDLLQPIQYSNFSGSLRPQNTKRFFDWKEFYKRL